MCGVDGGRLFDVVACSSKFGGVPLSLSVPVSPGQRVWLCSCPGWSVCKGQSSETRFLKWGHKVIEGCRLGWHGKQLML